MNEEKDEIWEKIKKYSPKEKAYKTTKRIVTQTLKKVLQETPNLKDVEEIKEETELKIMISLTEIEISEKEMQEIQMIMQLFDKVFEEVFNEALEKRQQEQKEEERQEEIKRQEEIHKKQKKDLQKRANEFNEMIRKFKQSGLDEQEQTRQLIKKLRDEAIYDVPQVNTKQDNFEKNTELEYVPVWKGKCETEPKKSKIVSKTKVKDVNELKKIIEKQIQDKDKGLEL